MKHFNHNARLSVRAPMFSQGGSGYTTADTVELYANGELLNRSDFRGVYEYAANAINSRTFDGERLHQVYSQAAATYNLFR